MSGLPLFITNDNKYRVGVMMCLLAVALYLPSNHIHLFEPQMLPMTWVDRWIPFLPNTVWIYLSEWLFFISVYIASEDLMNLNKYFYSYVALQCVSVIIFWLWPTTYPRTLFPLTPELNPVTNWVFSHLRVMDTPANCAPSLHVSSVYLSSFIFLDDQKSKLPLFFTWGTAIAISTLTTKQHYVVDVVSGFLMAAVTYYIFHRLIPYRIPAPLGAQAKR